MANIVKRINIEGMCRTRDLWTGSVSAGPYLDEEGDALDGVKPSTWSPQGSDKTERSVLVDEGSTWRNIPLYNFNILQAAEAEPAEVAAIVVDEVPELDDKFELLNLEPGSRDFYAELVDVLVYLSVDRSDGYGERYWLQPWQKAKERNPELLGEGREVKHPGKGATREQDRDDDELGENVQSASEVSW